MQVLLCIFPALIQFASSFSVFCILSMSVYLSTELFEKVETLAYSFCIPHSLNIRFGTDQTGGQKSCNEGINNIASFSIQLRIWYLPKN